MPSIGANQHFANQVDLTHQGYKRTENQHFLVYDLKYGRVSTPADGHAPSTSLSISTLATVAMPEGIENLLPRAHQVREYTDLVVKLLLMLRSHDDLCAKSAQLTSGVFSGKNVYLRNKMLEIYYPTWVYPASKCLCQRRMGDDDNPKAYYR